MKKKNIAYLILVILLINIVNPFFTVVNAASAPTYNTSKRGTKDTGSYLITNTSDFWIFLNKVTEDLDNGKNCFKLYKTIDAYYNPTTKAITYQFTTNFKSFLSSVYNSFSSNLTEEEYMQFDIGSAKRKDDSAYGSDIAYDDNYLTNSSDFTKIMSEYATYIKANNISQDGDEMCENNYHGYAIWNFITVGSYLALPTTTNYVYGVMSDSITITADGVVTPAKINAKVSRPSVALTYNGGSNASFSRNKEFTLTATISIPKYPVTDTATKSFKFYLDFNKMGVNYKWQMPQRIKMNYSNAHGPSVVTGSEVDVGKNEITLTDSSLGVDIATIHNLTDNYHDPLYFDIDVKNIYSDTITIEIPCIMPESPSINGNPLTLKGYLEYTEPYVSASSSAFITSKESQFTINTYGLQITGSAGAKFSVKEGNTVLGEVTIGTNGLGTLAGLAAGDYTVEQTTPPAGYTKLPSQTVKIGPGGTEVSGKAGYYGITLKNTILSTLPFTGSTGTILFTVVGALLIITSITILVIYKKKKQKKENVAI